MRILVIGDFGGPRPSALPLRTLPLDVDAPGLGRFGATIDGDGGPVAVRSADDFAPDALAAAGAESRRLLALRRRLEDGDPRAAEELETVLGAEAAAPPPSVTRSAPQVSAADLLASVLAETPGGAPSGDGGLEDIVRTTAAPGLRKIRDATGPERRRRLLQAADARLSEIVRGVLHAPRTRSLESAWRALDLLSRALVSVEGASIRVADCARAEIDADVGVSGPFTGELFRLLVDEADPETPRFDLVVLLYEFGAVPRDVATLLRLSRLAAAGGFTLLADAAPGLAAAPAATGPAHELWRAFRRTPEAARVGLAWPRVLLRAPYGTEHRRSESFDFDECGRPVDPRALLWGPAAAAVAAILGTAFEIRDGAWEVVAEAELGGLPAVTRTDEDGETVLVPCTETRPGASALRAATSAGVLPLVAAGDAAAVRLTSLTSAAEPSAPLAAG